MSVVFRNTKLTKPKLQGIRRNAYLNGVPLWIQPPSTTKQGSEPQYQTKPLFDPSLAVTASSNEPGRGNPQNIIDGNNNTLWQSAGAAPQWIYVTLLKPAAARFYVLTCNGSEPVNLPTAWQIRGSDDASTWTTLHSVSNWNPSDKWSQEWEIPAENPIKYKYYQFYCTNVRTNSYWCYLTEWQLYEYDKHDLTW
jgi:hypothetical protein